jgi:TP901 family phage tail tape measure protein
MGVAPNNGVRAGNAFVVINAINNTEQGLRAAERMFLRWGSRLTGMGQRLFSRLALAAVPTALGLRQFIAYDDVMRRTEARSEGTVAQLKQMKVQAAQLASTLGLTAREIGDIYQQLGQQGFNRGQAIDMTPAIAMFVKAGGEGKMEDARDATELVGSTLRQFNLQASETGSVVDMLAVAINESRLNINSLARGMQYAAPVAGVYKTSLQDTLAVLGTLSNLGYDATVAGTAMRNIYLHGSDSQHADDFNAALKELTGNTIAFTDAQGNLRSIPDLLRDIGTASEGLGTANVGNLYRILFGLRAIAPAMGLSGSAEELTRFHNAMRNFEGTAKRMTKVSEAGMGGAFRRLWGDVTNLNNALWSLYQDTLKELIDSISESVRIFQEWITKHRELILVIAGVAAGIAALAGVLMMLGMAASAIGSILSLIAMPFTALIGLGSMFMSLIVRPILYAVAALGTLGGALFAIAGPWSAFVGGAIALEVGAVAIAALKIAMDTLQNALRSANQLWKDFGSISKTAFEGISAAIETGNIEGAFRIIVDSVKLMWDDLSSHMRKVVRELFIELTNSAKAYAMILKDPISYLGDIGGRRAQVQAELDGSYDKSNETFDKEQDSIKARRKALEEQAKLAKEEADRQAQAEEFDRRQAEERAAQEALGSPYGESAINENQAQVQKVATQLADIGTEFTSGSAAIKKYLENQTKDVNAQDLTLQKEQVAQSRKAANALASIVQISGQIAENTKNQNESTVVVGF